MKSIMLLLTTIVMVLSACTNTAPKTDHLAANIAGSIDVNEEILAIKLNRERYQNHVRQTQKMMLSENTVRIEYIAEANTVILYFPQNEPSPNGKITFLNVLKTNKNYIFDLNTDISKRMFILVDGFEKGAWTIKIEWQGEDKIYTHQETLNIEPNDWARPIHQ